ncbi:hypothetical protein JXA32_13355 [Candidatus Sumerlaeota bacterium]|nr:hypothetical protein [Candidatus Sumerlaeota bacterium]
MNRFRRNDGMTGMPWLKFVLIAGALCCLAGCARLHFERVEKSAWPKELQGRRFYQCSGDYYYAASAKDVEDIGAAVRSAVEKFEADGAAKRAPGLIIVVQYDEEYPFNADMLIELLAQLSDQAPSEQRKSAEAVLTQMEAVFRQTGLSFGDVFKLAPVSLDPRNAHALLALPEATRDLYGWFVIAPTDRCVKRSLNVMMDRQFEKEKAGFVERSMAKSMIAAMSAKMTAANREALESVAAKCLNEAVWKPPLEAKTK